MMKLIINLRKKKQPGLLKIIIELQAFSLLLVGQLTHSSLRKEKKQRGKNQVQMRQGKKSYLSSPWQRMSKEEVRAPPHSQAEVEEQGSLAVWLPRTVILMCHRNKAE